MCTTKEDFEDVDEDDVSMSSLESGDDEEEHTMKIVGRGDSFLCCLQLEEYGAWKFIDI